MQRILDMNSARREGCFPIALCLRFYLRGVLFGCLAVGWSAVLASCRFFPHSDDDIFVPAGLDVLPAFQHL